MSSRKSKANKGKASSAKHTSPTARSGSAIGASGTAPAHSKGKGNVADSDLPQAGFLISCDIPTKQYIQYLNDKKSMDKKFILHDLDSTHVLVKLEARNEIEREIKVWLDENVYSAIEKVGEDLDVS
jgi:TFIIH basal transcription factor complex TTD-A subunit